MRRIQPRPMSPKADPVKKAAFRNQIRILQRRENPVLWFEDESAFWIDPGRYKVWAFKGTKPTCPCSGTHLRVNVMGAVRPEDGYFFAAQSSHGNRAVFQLFLELLQTHLVEGRPNYMILDNARFHYGTELKWGKIKPLYLPPYSPDLNPIETLWLRMKKQHFNGWWAHQLEQLELQVEDVLDLFMQHPEWIQRTCATTTYL